MFSNRDVLSKKLDIYLIDYVIMKVMQNDTICFRVYYIRYDLTDM